MPMNRYIKQIYTDTSGVALIEFLLVFPLLLLLLFGGIEIARLILIEQKLEKASYAIADIITQYKPATAAGTTEEIKETELTTNVFPIFSRIMAPYHSGERQAIIVTSIRKTADNAKIIEWQIACRDSNCALGGVESIANALSPGGINESVRGTNANLPTSENAALSGFGNTISDTNVIVTEVFYDYEPILSRLLAGIGNMPGPTTSSFMLAPKILVKRSYFAPRNGDLYDLPPRFPVE